jgi:hypothetical protein
MLLKLKVLAAQWIVKYVPNDDGYKTVIGYHAPDEDVVLSAIIVGLNQTVLPFAQHRFEHMSLDWQKQHVLLLCDRNRDGGGKPSTSLRKRLSARSCADIIDAIFFHGSLQYEEKAPNTKKKGKLPPKRPVEDILALFMPFVALCYCPPSLESHLRPSTNEISPSALARHVADIQEAGSVLLESIGKYALFDKQRFPGSVFAELRCYQLHTVEAISEFFDSSPAPSAEADRRVRSWLFQAFKTGIVSFGCYLGIAAVKVPESEVKVLLGLVAEMSWLVPVDDAIKECLSVACELHRHSKGDEQRRDRAGCLFSWSAYHILQMTEICAAMRDFIATNVTDIASASFYSSDSVSAATSSSDPVSASASSSAPANSAFGFLVVAGKSTLSSGTIDGEFAVQLGPITRSPDCIPGNEAIKILKLIANPCPDNFTAVRHTAAFQLFKDRIFTTTSDPAKPLNTISFWMAAGDYEPLTDALVHA